MKKLLFSTLLALAALTGWAQEPTTFTVGNFTYTVTDDEKHYVSVGQNSENAPSGAVVIPSSVTYETMTYTVTSIANSGFGANSAITGVTLPNTLTSIGDYAFQGCSSLASFSVPASVTTIGSDVFYLCSIPTFTFEASNTAIACNAVIPCTDHLFLYRDVNREGYELTTGAIKALTIGANVTTIYTDMFNGCTLLSSIEFSAATGLTSIGNYAFNNCGTFVPEPEADPVPNLTTIDLSNTNVTSIGDNAFSACNKLTTITLPSTLQTIGNYAFYGCSSLASFSVPGSVTTIGTEAFYTCSIPTFTFEASNKKITCNAVIPCTDHLFLYRDVNREGYELTTGAIKALTIGANVTTIYTNMFNGCTLLSSIDFSAATGLTSIGNYAFYSCGNHVPEQGEDPVPNLTAIDLSNTKVTSIGECAFNSCSKLETITLPSTLTSIGDYAFQDCRSLVSFSLPGSVTTISSDAFFNCSIPTFTFEASNTTLTWNTTVPCSGHLYLYRNLVDGYMPNGLKAVTIGENVTGIGTMFSEAVQLENVYVPWLSSPITIADGAFCETTYTDATLWIPGGTGDLYAATDGWKNFTNRDFSSFVVSITASAHGTLAVADISSTNGEEEKTLIDRGEDAVFTVTPATGYELTTFTVNGDDETPTEGSYTVEDLSADQTVVAGFTPITYNLNYTLNGGTVASANPTTYNIESAAITLNAPTREGYDFTGWTGTELDVATKTVTIAAGSIGDRSYTATWTPVIYNITYTLDGGTVATANPTTYTIESPNITLNNPTKTGYTFKGWKLNGVGEAMMSVVITTGSTGDKAYTATWQVNQYTLTFNSNGGSDVDPITQDYGTAITAPGDPTRTGYTFASWSPAIPATMPAENMTLVAQWTINHYTVSITGSGVSADNYSPKYGDDVVITIATDEDRTLNTLTVNGTDVTANVVNNQYTIENVSSNITVVATFNSTKERIDLATEVATFSCSQDLNFTGSELKAYIAAGYNKSTNTTLLVRVYDVPAGTGLILKGEIGQTYKIPYAESSSYYVNMLKANLTEQTIAATTGDMSNYLLNKKNGEYGFFKPSESNTLGAQKAYLQVPTSFVTAEARVINLIFEDEGGVTNIQDYVMPGKSAEGLYNLNGMRVKTASKGVYIQNGRKVVKK